MIGSYVHHGLMEGKSQSVTNAEEFIDPPTSSSELATKESSVNVRRHQGASVS